ncbi:hypothetical protein LEMLEM_LOCUS27879, partial [Lemmus lemmus]
VSCHTTDCHLLLPQCGQAPNTDIQGAFRAGNVIGQLIYVLTWSLFTNPHSCPTLSKSEGSSPEGIPA